MKTWSQIAVEFTESLRRFDDVVVKASADGPMSAEQLQTLEDSLDLFIPDSLQDFLLADSASCKCKYYLREAKNSDESPNQRYGTELANDLALQHVNGGATICNSEHFASWNSEGLKSVFDFDEELSELWQSAFIFASIGNGDYLGLDCRNDFIDPKVIYLDHEGEIRPPFANSLNDFLFDWQRIGYIGPEIWVLEKYLDPTTCFLDWNLAAND